MKKQQKETFRMLKNSQQEIVIRIICIYIIHKLLSNHSPLPCIITKFVGPFLCLKEYLQLLYSYDESKTCKIRVKFAIVKTFNLELSC